MKCKNFLLMLLFLFVSTFAIAETNSPPPKDFFILTVPKSGTHLLMKLVEMLTQRTPDTLHDVPPSVLNEPFFEQRMFLAKTDNRYVYQHFSHYNHKFYLWPYFYGFGKRHPEYVKFLIIRDIKDVIISLLNHSKDGWKNKIEFEMRKNASFDEKLLFFLARDRSLLAQMLLENIVLATEWKKDPSVVVLRFEDLVGPLGGGDVQSQEASINTIANHLGITLSAEELQNIKDNLFGNTYTFRKGQIGSWKDYFKPYHLELFNKKWLPFQQALEGQ